MSDYNDDLLNKIYNKVERIDDKIASMDNTMTKQQVILDEHIKRTEILESRTDKIFDELLPLKIRKQMVDGAIKAGKIVGATLGVVSVVLGILKTLHII